MILRTGVPLSKNERIEYTKKIIAVSCVSLFLLIRRTFFKKYVNYIVYFLFFFSFVFDVILLMSEIILKSSVLYILPVNITLYFKLYFVFNFIRTRSPT